MIFIAIVGRCADFRKPGLIGPERDDMVFHDVHLVAQGNSAR